MRVRCTAALREARGEPQSLPTTTPANWIREAPADWKDLLPLLQKTPEGRKGAAAPAGKPAPREN
jgi:hypothetical protein